ncbi:MAG: GGDEF domain-containing response regulator [Acidobacteriaceae bacterium]
MKILIADDDAVSRRMLEKMLERAGYEVQSAENGRDAVEQLFHADGPRLLLIDWMMPEMDGPGVCREVRNRHDHAYTYIILLTSKQSKEDIVMGLEAGADDYLTKPCHIEELKARLRTGQRILQLEDTLVEAREEMRFKATHDALTSLWNRGAVLSLLERELQRAKREHNPISLLLCDLDHFKQVNDVHGHLVGDFVLQETARRLSTAVRPYDAVGRYGGEEFLILLTGCNADDVQERAEQIRLAIANSPIQMESGTLPLSISIGALTTDGAQQPMNTADLLQRVDTALYQAKAAGRNRVVYAE